MPMKVRNGTGGRRQAGAEPGRERGCPSSCGGPWRLCATWRALAGAGELVAGPSQNFLSRSRRLHPSPRSWVRAPVASWGSLGHAWRWPPAPRLFSQLRPMPGFGCRGSLGGAQGSISCRVCSRRHYLRFLFILGVSLKPQYVHVCVIIVREKSSFIEVHC